MARTVQIRGIADETYAMLLQQATGAGLGPPEYLRRELTRLAERTETAEAMRAQRELVAASDREPTRKEILAALRGGR
jgi:hypothetical protein